MQSSILIIHTIDQEATSHTGAKDITSLNMAVIIPQNLNDDRIYYSALVRKLCNSSLYFSYKHTRKDINLSFLVCLCYKCDILTFK